MDYWDDEPLTFREAWSDLTGTEKVRFVIGIAARGVFWVCFWFILLNAVVQTVKDGQYFLAFIELAVFPLTVFVYPFVADAGALAWPLEAGTSLIPALITMLIAYPVSTFVGGLPPVDR